MLPPLFLLVDVLAAGIHGVHPARVRSAVLQSWPLWAAASIYLIVRSQSGAFGLADAPPFYRLTLDLRVVIKNAMEYLDRGATWAFALALLLFLIVPKGMLLDDDQRRVIRCGSPLVCIYVRVTEFRTDSFESLCRGTFDRKRTGGRLVRLASAACRATSIRIASHSSDRYHRVADSGLPHAESRGLIDPADLSTQAMRGNSTSRARPATPSRDRLARRSRRASHVAGCLRRPRSGRDASVRLAAGARQHGRSAVSRGRKRRRNGVPATERTPGSRRPVNAPLAAAPGPSPSGCTAGRARAGIGGGLTTTNPRHLRGHQRHELDVRVERQAAPCTPPHDRRARCQSSVRAQLAVRLQHTESAFSPSAPSPRCRCRSGHRRCRAHARRARLISSAR